MDDETIGVRLPVVLIHGFPFDSRIWQEQASAFSDMADVMPIDLPGFGESLPLGGQATIDSYADAIADWASGEGLNKIVLVGHSMGGYIALAFARKHAGMLSGLGLICTRAGADTEAAKENRMKQASEVRQRGPQVLVDAMLNKLFAPWTIVHQPGVMDAVRAIMLDQSVEGIVAALGAMAERPDSTSMLGSIKVPTLVVAGVQDQIILASEGSNLAGQIENATFVPVEDAGHLPMLEQPETFNDILGTFLENCEGI